ncbi:MAG TPA: type II methionyl aminopeptidase [Candidatus Altiarchaeales archaeon]|nr:type II methionyl aminopeptidase [Candidatus Altiarchaeales archaeon]
MEAEEEKKILKAGEISGKVREWSRKLVKPGAKIVEIADAIEAEINKEGGRLAFPVNVCINDVTAHYAPKFNDETVLGEADVVSIDLGAHVDGYIGDTAYTIDLGGEYGDLLEANERALEESLKLVAPGVSVSEIGKTVQEILEDAGFKPIENLSGHEIGQYNLHAGLSIPNIKVPYDWRVEEGMVLAFEPFATNGYGRVIESAQAEIYGMDEGVKVRDREARKILREMEERKGLPFAVRWYAEKMSPVRLGMVLNQLSQQEIIKRYPPLHEKEKGIVSQFEHTVIVTEDGCKITTK